MNIYMYARHSCTTLLHVCVSRYVCISTCVCVYLIAGCRLNGLVSVTNPRHNSSHCYHLCVRARVCKKCAVPVA